MKDEDLIRYCKENNRLAQRILFDKFYQQCFHIAYRYLNNYHDVEDVVSTVFTKIFNKIHSFEERGNNSLIKWINTIVINESIRFFHKREKIIFSENIAEYSEKDNNCIFDFTRDAENIYKIIGELPNPQRIVFNLFVIDEFSHKEIADKLSISINTSKSHLHRAKIQIRNKLSIIEQ